MGLGFLVGMLGAYIFVELFVRLGYMLSLNEILSGSNFNYLINAFSGLITGALVIIVSKERQLRILYFVVASLVIMDGIAFLSSANFTSTRLSYRLLLDVCILVSGVLTYKAIYKSEKAS